VTARSWHRQCASEIRETLADPGEVPGYESLADPVQPLPDSVDRSDDATENLARLTTDVTPEVVRCAVDESLPTGAWSGDATLGLLLSPTPSRRTPGTFPGAIHSLPPELPVTPLDPQVESPDASFRLQEGVGGSGSSFSRGAADGSG